ncbi:cation/H(+) antiporter 20 isoform X2 [Henckelia pumila]|uniref:cation/H(+) antiporter 20 isoform X2 n=1 Tax=Henckelia pumila TaxID=405737 RepID=UPI003C6E004D
MPHLTRSATASTSINQMAVNISSIRSSSNGVWEGDNPLHYAFPVLIVQTILILSVSRFLALLFKPFRQPKVIAETVGGILLGPSALGRNQEYMHRIFPEWSTPILGAVASIGLLFFLFLVGIELDISSIRRSGRRAFAIAVAGICIPLGLGVGVAFVFRKSIDGAEEVGFPQYLVFMGVALSITAFPVLARILAELKLLTTSVGETAMAAAALNDVVAWILLALAVALAGNGGGADGPHKSPLISVWVLLSVVSFVVFMMVVIKPAMKWVAQRCSPERRTSYEAYTCLTLAGVMAAGFVTDFIGVHSIFGGFVFGLTIPKEGNFAEKLMERIEDFVSELLLPLYFALSGLKTDITKIHGGAWGLLALVIAAACAGKIIGTFAVAMMLMIPLRESITLGVLMNTKGLVELIVLNIGKEMKVINDEAFAILVLMAIFTTFMTTPTVMAIYKPAGGGLSNTPHRRLASAAFSGEFRVLACVHGPGNISHSLINLLKLTRGLAANSSRLKLYIMHLLELTERSSSICMLQRLHNGGFPFVNRCESQDRVTAALTQAANGQLGRVSVRVATAISPSQTMHEDICRMAEDKAAAMILLQFHENWRRVDQMVLKEAQCSVAVLVERGFIGGEEPYEAEFCSAASTAVQNVCVVYFGGADDMAALELGGRMAEHPGAKVVVVEFGEGGCSSSLKPSSPESSSHASKLQGDQKVST